MADVSNRPKRHAGVTTRFALLLWGAFSLVSIGAAQATHPADPAFDVVAQAEEGGGAEQGSASVGETVKGIITYTRWPARLQQLRFCFIGESAHEAVILHRVLSLAPAGAISFQRFEAGRETLFGCDVAYIAEPGALDGDFAMARLADSKWILTIGEGEEFCSLGGMFCLSADSDGARFATNLDAISRSELKVNPLVLKLSRQLRAVEP